MKLNMNSKGFYTALVSLIVVALISVTIIQLDSFNKQNQSQAFNDNAVDLQIYWNNAKLVIDKSASNILGRQFALASCSNNFDLDTIMKTELELVLNSMKENNKSCLIKGISHNMDTLLTYNITIELQCTATLNNENQTQIVYSNTTKKIKILKEISFTNTTGCQVKVKDIFSEVTEFDSATAK